MTTEVWITFDPDDGSRVWHRWLNAFDPGPDPVQTYCGLADWMYTDDDGEVDIPVEVKCVACLKTVR